MSHRLAGRSTPLHQQHEKHDLRLLTDGRWDVKPFSGRGPETASVRHVGDTCEWRRQVKWCRGVHCTLQHAEPMETDKRVGDVVATSQVEDAAFWTDWRRGYGWEAGWSGDCCNNPSSWAQVRTRGIERRASGCSNWSRVAKQWDAVRCTWVFIVRSWSMKTPRSRTFADGETKVERIKGPEVGSRCWLRAVVSHMNSVLSEPPNAPTVWTELSNLK